MSDAQPVSPAPAPGPGGDAGQTPGAGAGTVRVEVADPADPTPYWLTSTRHPERIVEVLSARPGARPPPPHGRTPPRRPSTSRSGRVRSIGTSARPRSSSA